MCGIDLTSYVVGEYVLVADDNDFEVTVANADWFQGPTEVTLTANTELQTAHYRVEMARDPLFTQLSLIIPSFLLNTISFSQHWIPTRTDQINLDRGGMAITTILAALALRDTMISEVGTAFTLLDLFLLVSLVFQFIGFMITAFESSYGQVKGGGDETNTLGIGDRLGKVVVPIIFGVFNTILSIFWGGGMWILSYLSIALCLGVSVLARKDRQRFQQKLKESMTKSLRKASLKAKLGYSIGGGSSGHGADAEQRKQDNSTESIVRYWRWQTYKRRALSARQETLDTAMTAEEENQFVERATSGNSVSFYFDEESALPIVQKSKSKEDQASTTLQRAFRRHSSASHALDPSAISSHHYSGNNGRVGRELSESGLFHNVFGW